MSGQELITAKYYVEPKELPGTAELRRPAGDACRRSPLESMARWTSLGMLLVLVGVGAMYLAECGQKQENGPKQKSVFRLLIPHNLVLWMDGSEYDLDDVHDRLLDMQSEMNQKVQARLQESNRNLQRQIENNSALFEKALQSSRPRLDNRAGKP